MESSLAAARMMAVNPPGERPTWKDLGLEIGKKGDLVRVEPRVREGNLESVRVISVVAPANLHFTSENVGAYRQTSARREASELP
jgi:hypothetical protein